MCDEAEIEVTIGGKMSRSKYTALVAFIRDQIGNSRVEDDLDEEPPFYGMGSTTVDLEVRLIEEGVPFHIFRGGYDGHPPYILYWRHGMTTEEAMMVPCDVGGDPIFSLFQLQGLRDEGLTLADLIEQAGAALADAVPSLEIEEEDAVAL